MRRSISVWREMSVRCRAGLKHSHQDLFIVFTALLVCEGLQSYGWFEPMAPVWESLGPTRIPRSDGRAGAGKLQAFAAQGLNPAIMYAGGGVGPGNSGPFSQAGVYKTIDGGKTWIQVNKGLGDPAVDALWLDQSNPDTILAGTWSGGIYRTTDGGGQWRSVQTCTAITSGIAPVTSFLATVSALFAASAQGVLRSNDKGATWCLEYKTDAPVRALAGSGDTLYAGLDDGRVIVRIGQGSFFSSQLSKALSTIWTLSADPGNPQTCYAVVWKFGNSVSVETLYLTKDGGHTWSAVPPLPGSPVQFVAFQASDHNVIFIGQNGGLFRSTDHGDTWSALNNTPWDVRLIVPDAGAVPGKLIVGSDQGLFLSDDNGATWNSLNGNVSSSILYTLSLNDSTILATSQDYPVLKTDDAGQNWFEVPGTTETGEVVFDPTDSSFGYIFDLGGFHYTRDGGKTFMLAHSGDGRTLVPPSYVNSSPNIIAVDRKNPFTVYAVSDEGFQKSTDRGQSFQRQNWPLPEHAGTIAVAPSDSQTIYAGVYTGTGSAALYFSHDGGATWAQSNFGGQVGDLPFAIAIDPFDANDVMVGMSHIPPHGGLFRSTDGGRKFAFAMRGFDIERDNSYGIPSISGVAFDPANPGRVGVSAWSGMYVSADRGVHWKNIKGNAVPYVFSGLAWSGGYLYATTFGQGLLRTRVEMEHSIRRRR